MAIRKFQSARWMNRFRPLIFRVDIHMFMSIPVNLFDFEGEHHEQC